MPTSYTFTLHSYRQKPEETGKYEVLSKLDIDWEKKQKFIQKKILTVEHCDDCEAYIYICPNKPASVEDILSQN